MSDHGHSHEHGAHGHSHEHHEHHGAVKCGGLHEARDATAEDQAIADQVWFHLFL